MAGGKDKWAIPRITIRFHSMANGKPIWLVSSYNDSLCKLGQFAERKKKKKTPCVVFSLQDPLSVYCFERKIATLFFYLLEAKGEFSAKIETTLFATK